MVNDDDIKRVRKYSSGAQVIFENAEALYNEAQLIGNTGALARAAALHQLSMEECAKIDMLGAYATSLLAGHGVDDEVIARVFREHKTKNYANAYNAKVTPDETEAQARGDWAASSDAFNKFQRQFHLEINAIKNSALYVDFKDGEFVSPKDVVTEHMAAALMHMNAEYLQRSALFVRLLRRIESDPKKYAESVTRAIEQAESRRQEGNFDPDKILEEMMEELRMTIARDG